MAASTVFAEQGLVLVDRGMTRLAVQLQSEIGFPVTLPSGNPFQDLVIHSDRPWRAALVLDVTAGTLGDLGVERSGCLHQQFWCRRVAANAALRFHAATGRVATFAFVGEECMGG